MKLRTCCLTVSLFLALPALAGQGEQVKTEPEKPKTALKFYLDAEAQAVGCRFTLEYVRPKAISPSSEFYLETIEVPDVTNDAKSVEQVVKNLTRVLPGAVVWADKDNPKLVHLMDARLTKLPDYVMNKTGKIHYEGLLANLTDVVGSALNLNLASQDGVAFSGNVILEDFVTTVKIDTPTESVRSILSNHIPRKSRSSILWESTTILTPKTKTGVTYYR